MRKVQLLFEASIATSHIMIRLLVRTFPTVFILPHWVSSNLPHKPHNVQCSQLIVFGDDFTDDGMEFNTDSHGFLRNSNGPVWSEYLNEMLKCDEYCNYAYSGATSGYDNIFFTDWSGILWQIEYYFMSHRIVPKNSLIILQLAGVKEVMLQQQNDNKGSIDVDKINENIANAIRGLINTMENGIIIIANLVDPFKAPGYAMLNSNENDDLDVSSIISQINSKVWKLIVAKDRVNRQFGLFDLNAALIDAMQGLNTEEPFTYQQNNMSSLNIFDYAYYNEWYPTTVIHYKIAQKLSKFLEDL